MKKYACYFLMAVLCMSCQKIKYEEGQGILPLESQKGRRIVGCYIDDYTYTARRQPNAVYNEDTGYLFIHSVNTTFELRFFIHSGLFDEGIYELENTGEEWISADFDHYYGIDSTGINQFQVKYLDLDDKIIAGTFNLDLVDELNNPKKIRNGRFDLELSLLD